MCGVGGGGGERGRAASDGGEIKKGGHVRVEERWSGRRRWEPRRDRYGERRVRVCVCVAGACEEREKRRRRGVVARYMGRTHKGAAKAKRGPRSGATEVKQGGWRTARSGASGVPRWGGGGAGCHNAYASAEAAAEAEPRRR